MSTHAEPWICAACTFRNPAVPPREYCEVTLHVRRVSASSIWQMCIGLPGAALLELQSERVNTNRNISVSWFRGQLPVPSQRALGRCSVSVHFRTPSANLRVKLVAQRGAFRARR